MTTYPLCSLAHSVHTHTHRYTVSLTIRTTTLSCRTRKRAVHVYSPGVAAARHVRALQCSPPPLLLLLLL